MREPAIEYKIASDTDYVKLNHLKNKIYSNLFKCPFTSHAEGPYKYSTHEAKQKISGINKHTTCISNTVEQGKYGRNLFNFYK